MRDALTITRTSRRAGLPLSTAHRFAGEMTCYGALERDADACRPPGGRCRFPFRCRGRFRLRPCRPALTRPRLRAMPGLVAGGDDRIDRVAVGHRPFSALPEEFVHAGGVAGSQVGPRLLDALGCRSGQVDGHDRR